MAQFPWSGAARRHDPSQDRTTPDPARLDAVRFKPAFVREPAEPAAPPAEWRGARDRRNVSTRKALAKRVCSEFEEMPGLALTLTQAARLFGIPRDMCLRVLVQLVDKELLRLTPDGRFALRVGAN